jgi:cadmium resistance protein CadD (predicted permease)
VAVVGVGIVLFATTNIDDILLLSAFFADRTLRPLAVVVGQFAGIGALTLASTIAALLALAIPDGWIALLGLAPLVLGIQGLRKLWRFRTPRNSDDAERLHEAQARASATRSQWIVVALVTMANGGDNLGVYPTLLA